MRFTKTNASHIVRARTDLALPDSLQIIVVLAARLARSVVMPKKWIAVYNPPKRRK